MYRDWDAWNLGGAELMKHAIAITLTICALLPLSACPRANATTPDDGWIVAVTTAHDIYNTPVEIASIHVEPGEVYEIGSVMMTVLNRPGFQDVTAYLASSDGTYRRFMRDGNFTAVGFNGDAIVLQSINIGHPDYVSGMPRIIATDFALHTFFSQPGGAVETIVIYRRVK